MEYCVIDPKADTQITRQLAIWHNETPRLWQPDYEATEEEILSTMERMYTETSYLAVAKAETLIGFIWAKRQDEHVMIMSLYVEKSHRHQHVATNLKEKLEAWCIEEGIDRIVTTVHSKNEKMLQLNKKMGYEAQMIHMEKRLSK